MNNQEIFDECIDIMSNATCLNVTALKEFTLKHNLHPANIMTALSERTISHSDIVIAMVGNDTQGVKMSLDKIIEASQKVGLSFELPNKKFDNNLLQASHDMGKLEIRHIG